MKYIVLFSFFIKLVLFYLTLSYLTNFSIKNKKPVIKLPYEGWVNLMTG